MTGGALDLDLDAIADEVLLRLQDEPIGTVITVRPGGELLIEEPGGPPLSGSDRRGEIAVFVATTLPPSRVDVIARIRAGIARLQD